MNQIFIKGLMSLFLLSTLSSCGSDSETSSSGGATASAQALEYYSQFLNSVDGKPTNTELIGNTFNNTQVGNGQMALRLDSNHTFEVYIKSFTTTLNNQSVFKSGIWRIEGDILVLEGYAKTFSTINSGFNNNFNTSVNTGTNGCFVVQITEAISTSAISGTFLNTTVGQQIQFCKQVLQ